METLNDIRLNELLREEELRLKSQTKSLSSVFMSLHRLSLYNIT